MYNKVINKEHITLDDLDFLSNHIEFINGKKNEKQILTLSPSQAFELVQKETSNKAKNIQLLINNVSELSIEKLNTLCKYFYIEGIKINDPTQSLTRQIKAPYTVESYKKCRKRIDELIEEMDLNNIPNSKDRDLVIFSRVIRKIANSISYDNDSYIGGRKAIEEDNILRKKIHLQLKNCNLNDWQKRFREKVEFFQYKKYNMSEIEKRCCNMEGALLDDTCVCTGYSEIIREILNCCGIETNFMWGWNTTTGKRSSHAWNQVKLNGKWYNMDLTLDRKNIIKNLKPEFLLQSDKDFNSPKHPYYAKECKSKICSETYSQSKLLKFLYPEKKFDENYFEEKLEKIKYKDEER